MNSNYQLSNDLQSNGDYPFSLENSAILVIDMQNDFIEGSLRVDLGAAKQDPRIFIPKLNEITKKPFKLVVFSRDWHPSDHISFFDNLKNWKLHTSSKEQDKSKIETFDEVVLVNSHDEPYVQKLWPVHCVKDSYGAEFYSTVEIPECAIILNKGMVQDLDCYSAFGLCDKRADTGLNEILKQNNITTVFVCGIATDWCVSATCKDASALGYNVILIQDLCSGIDPDTIMQKVDELHQKWFICLSSSHEVDSLSLAHFK